MQRVIAVLACVVTLMVAEARSSAFETPRHLLDGPGVESGYRVFDGVGRRVLSPGQKVHSFPLGDEASFAALVFSTGVPASAVTGNVQFRILLRAASGRIVTLFDEERALPGWHDGRVDLHGYDLRGARLDFVKRHVTGSVKPFLTGVWGEPILLPSEAVRRPAVILISLDTLRADRVGAYGYGKAKTPNLDAFAKDAVLYTDAYSASTWTLPSHHALLRGVDPWAFEDMQREGGWSASEPLPPALAEVFRDAGYLTAGFTGGGYMSAALRFGDGFDSYFTFESPEPVNPPNCPPERFDGPEVFRRAGQWARAHGDLPFFLFVHTYDVHDRCEVLPAERPNHLRDAPETLRKKFIDHYDLLIGRVDRLFGALMRDLEAAGIADTAIIAVTSDHGEALWEHVGWGHGCSSKPYEELIRVPLIVRAPKGATKGRIDGPVAAVDLAPTLLRLAGLPVPKTMRGLPLPGLGFDRPAQNPPVFVHCGDWLAVRAGTHKLITSRTGKRADEVYHLSRDPGERANIVRNEEAAAHELRRLAEEYWGRIPAQGTPGNKTKLELDEKTRERLRALGYLE